MGHRRVWKAVVAAFTASALLASPGAAQAQRASSMGEGAPVGQSGIQLYNFRDYLSSGSGEILCPAAPQPATPYCTPTLPANNVLARMERLFAFLKANDIKNVELYGYPGNPFPSDSSPQGNLQGTMDLRMPLWMFYAVASVGTSVAVLLAIVRVVLLWRGDEDALRHETLEPGGVA